MSCARSTCSESWATHRRKARGGLASPPFNLSVVVGSLIGPRLTEKIGERAAMVSGLLAIAVGVLLLARIPPAGGHYGHLLPSFVLMGAGLGCASVASTASGTSAAEDEKQGLASGPLNAAAQVGTALGLAVLIPLSATRTDALAGIPLGAALVEGFRLGFFGAAVIAALGALLCSLPDPRAEVRNQEPLDLARRSRVAR